MVPILDGVSVFAEYIHLSIGKESKYIGFSNVANTIKHYFGLVFVHIGMNIIISYNHNCVFIIL